MVQCGGRRESVCVIGDAGGVRGAQRVYKVSSVSGSCAKGRKVSSNGSGPVWAGGSGVEDRRWGFEGQGVQGCLEGFSEDEGETLC